MGWLSRRESEPVDPQQVIDAAHGGSGVGVGLGMESPIDAASGGVPAVGASAFCMRVNDVFTIKGRGTVATGTVGTGRVAVGQHIAVHRAGGELLRARVEGIEAFRRSLTAAETGDTVGILLGTSAVGAQSGDILVAVG